MKQMKPEPGDVLDMDQNLPANENILRPLCTKQRTHTAPSFTVCEKGKLICKMKLDLCTSEVHSYLIYALGTLEYGGKM